MDTLTTSNTTNAVVRICHVIGRMNCGGAETMIMNLYRCIDRERIQFDFLVHTSEESDFDSEIKQLGGHIYHAPNISPSTMPALVNHYDSFFKSHRFHAVHGHLGSTATWYLKAAKRYGMFTIAHSHARHFPLSLRECAFRIMSYRTRYVADYFLACSKVAGLDRFGTQVVEGDRFHVLHNGIDTALYKFNAQSRFAIRKELGIEQQAPMMGHVGRLTKIKNQSFLMDAFRQVLHSLPNAQLVFVGRGEDEEKLKAYAKKLGIANHVVFTGLRNDIPRILCAFDIFVFPSIREGLPLSVIEAQASGLPTVISDGVPTEAAITPLAHALELSQGAKTWAQILQDLLRQQTTANENEKFTQREVSYKAVAKAGYDTTNSAKWLEDFYLSI